jgi:hypothetical protein
MAAALLLAGFGVRLALNSYFDSLTQPLTVRAQVPQGAELAAIIQQGRRYNSYTITTPLTLIIENPPRSTETNYVEGPQVNWKVESLQYHRKSDNAWIDVPRPPGSERNKQDPRLYFYQTRSPREEKAGNQYQLELPYDVGFYGDTEWRGRIQAQVEYIADITEPKRFWQGTTTFDVQGGTNQTIIRPAETPTPTATPETRSLILKIQWTRQDKRGWQDVPKPGQKGYPITVTPYQVIGFRVIKRFPKVPWPNVPKFLPYWTAEYAEGKPTEFMGDDVYIQWPLVSGTKEHRIVAHAGNSVSAEIKVVPESADLP